MIRKMYKQRRCEQIS